MTLPHCWRLYLPTLLCLLSLAGCGHSPAQNNATPTATVTPVPKKVALVLGGGGARGFAHVGVIRELENAKIPIDMIVGVSVGSLIGALYADQPDAFQLEWKAFQIQKEEIFDFTLFNLKDGLARGEAIRNYVDKNVRAKNLEQLKIPLAVVATDIRRREQVVFKSGPVKDAIRASTSIPGVFVPVVANERVLVDGGVMGNLAPRVAKDWGADVVIGVNISQTRRPPGEAAPNMLSVLMESVDIMESELVRLHCEKLDLLIEPDVGASGIMDFTRKRELIEAGRQAALRAIPRIKELLAY